MSVLEFLHQRKSVSAAQLGPPAPTAGQLRELLQLAVRVPDHGRLTPWRVLGIEGQARHELGEFLVRRSLELDPNTPPPLLEKNRRRFARAPLVLVVIHSPQQPSRIPAVEQLLSAGNVCFALLHAAAALGFGAQWLTGWAAYDPAVQAHLGLAPHESITGFVHLGTPLKDAPDRQRPDPDQHFMMWSPPT